MKRSNLVWVVIAVLVVALLGTGIFIYMQHKAMSDFKEQVEIDKQRSELEKEYSDLAAQYDQFEGQKMMFNNDSLIEKLECREGESSTIVGRVADCEKYEFGSYRGIKAGVDYAAGNYASLCDANRFVECCQ